MRILIVEDEPDIALGLEDDLRVEGYQVEVVTDGETASRRGREPSCGEKSSRAPESPDICSAFAVLGTVSMAETAHKPHIVLVPISQAPPRMGSGRQIL